MPAIQPVRLKTQAAQLAEKFSQPAAFARGLRDLLEEYADHTHHQGQAGEPAPILASFKTPPPVLRQVWLEVQPLVSTHPQEALAMSDVLWRQSYIEHRTMAADILGHLSVSFQNEVINRVQFWTREGIEDRLVDTLLERGLTRLRRQSSPAVIKLIEQWLASKEPTDKQLGLRLLNSLACDLSFTDLPALFRLLTPHIRIAPPLLRPEIISVLKTLIQRSAPEAAFMLRQNLAVADNPDTAWLLRQVITEFPPDLQASLRQEIRRK